MRLRDLFRTVMLVTVVVWLMAPSADAQRGRNRGAQMPQYDAKNEVTIKGTVEEVQSQMPRAGTPGRGAMTAMGGVHLTLSTEKGNRDVRVGPANYLAEKKFVINKGDTLEITGSLIKIDGKEALIAREITKGSEKLVLRDGNGIPLWSGSRFR